MRASPSFRARSSVSTRVSVTRRDGRSAAVAAAVASLPSARETMPTTLRRGHRICPASSLSRPRPQTSATNASSSPLFDATSSSVAPRRRPPHRRLGPSPRTISSSLSSSSSSLIARASLPGSNNHEEQEEEEEEPSALLIECDGVALDAAVDGHRVAFNRAFRELGMDCTSFSPALYADLVRTGDGTGEGLVAVYFNTVGWPTMLATSDRVPFTERVHALKAKHLRLMAEGGEIPLRKGVIDLVDEALGSGARVAVVAGTASGRGDGLGEAALRAFGRERDVALLHVPGGAGRRGGDGSDGSDDDDENGDDKSSEALEAGFAAAAARLKAQGAAALVASVAASRASDGGGDGDGVVIDPALLAASRRASGADPSSSSSSPSSANAAGISSAWLSAAAAAALGVRPSRCAVVAASSSVLDSARAAGMVAVAAPPRSGRALGSYPMAHAVCDGFGAGGGVTWRRVRALIEKNVEQLEALRREAEERRERLG